MCTFEFSRVAMISELDDGGSYELINNDMIDIGLHNDHPNMQPIRETVLQFTICPSNDMDPVRFNQNQGYEAGNGGGPKAAGTAAGSSGSPAHAAGQPSSPGTRSANTATAPARSGSTTRCTRH